MTTTFSHDDIRDWSKFSADNNPVHFEVEQALQAGLKDIIVQGMLVMLRSKELLEPYIQPNSCINFYLKKPIYVNESVHYQVIEKKNRISLKVMDALQEEAISANVTYNAQPLFETPKTKIVIPENYFKEQIALFKDLYPEINSSTILADALLFSFCFKLQKGECFYDIPNHKAQIQRLLDTHQAFVFQSSHKTFISETLFNLKQLDPSKLSASYEVGDFMSSPEMLHLSLNYQLFYEESMLCQTEISGITKLKINKEGNDE